MSWLENYMASLTERERQIVILLGQGLAPKQIARLLNLRVSTVRQHLFEARQKALCTTTIELAIKVVKAQAGD